VKNVSLAPTGWNTVVLPPGNVFTGPPDVVDSVPFLVAWIANAPITVAIIQGDTTTVIGTGASGRVTTPSAITLGPAQFQITAGSTPIESIQVSVLSAQSEGYLPLAGGTMLGPIVGTLTGTASNTKELQGVSVSETAPATSDVLEYNGAEWVPSVPSAALPTPTATGDVLTATGTAAGDYDWAAPTSELPVPGASGDVLTATGTAAGDYDWAAPAAPTLAYGGSGLGGGSYAASTFTVVATTPTLQPGTYLVTAGMIISPQTEPSDPSSVTLELQAGSATASFEGQNQASSVFGPYNSTNQITLTIACITTVTAAGTLQLMVNPSVSADGGGGGYNYVQIA
jgi:hypothetical protein